MGLEVGVGQRAPFLLTLIAIFELFGKLLMAFFSDRGLIQRRYILIIAALNSSLAIFSEFYDRKVILKSGVPFTNISVMN